MSLAFAYRASSQCLVFLSCLASLATLVPAWSCNVSWRYLVFAVLPSGSSFSSFLDVVFFMCLVLGCSVLWLGLFEVFFPSCVTVLRALFSTLFCSRCSVLGASPLRT